MTYALALAEAQDLKRCLESVGVRVSLELQPGAGGQHWYIPTHRVEFSHHTVSRPSMGPTPCLRLVKVGRPDVPGPLCNAYGGFDRVARIITMGRANHPGAGGPLTIDGVTIPRDNARVYAFGWEFEGGLEPWDEPMHDFMARCAAGTLLWLRKRGATVEAHAEHKTWAPTRKIDRLNYTRAGAIRRIEAVLGGATPPAGFTPAVPTETIQQRLGLVEDGHYGPLTTAAVKAYQEANGLYPDGEWGPVTEAHYQEEYAMPTAEEIAAAVWGHKFGPAVSPANGTSIPAETAGARLREIRKAATFTNATVKDTAGVVAALGAPEVDPTTLAAALAAALPRDLAAAVAAQLTITTREA